MRYYISYDKHGLEVCFDSKNETERHYYNLKKGHIWPVKTHIVGVKSRIVHKLNK